jgi:O-acetylserine/cysteine efflux transporter
MKVVDIFLATLVALIWGFNFVVIEIGLGSFPPILFSALRFLCAAFPAVLFLRRDGIDRRWILSIGFTLGVVMFSLLFIGMDVGMPAGLSSLVLQIQVVFTLVLSGILLHDSPTAWQRVGVVVAIGGIGLLAVEVHDTTTLLGLILVISAGFAWAVSNILMKLSGHIDMLRLIVWVSIVPPLPLLLISWMFEEGQMEAITSISWAGVGAIAYVGLISTVLAFAIWGRLFREYSPNTVAPFALLVPIFGIVSSTLVLRERFTTMELLSLCLVLTGLILVVLGPKVSRPIAVKWNRVVGGGQFRPKA